MLSNKLFDELAVGQEASITRIVTPDDFLVFAHASGNLNPAHLPDESGRKVSQPAAPAMWVGSLFSAVLGNILPGAERPISRRRCASMRARISATACAYWCGWKSCDLPPRSL